MTVQKFPKAVDGIPMICACLREAAWGIPNIDKYAEAEWPIDAMSREQVVASGVLHVLRRYAEIAKKPLYVFSDEEVAALYALHTAETGQVFMPPRAEDAADGKSESS